MPGPKLLRGTHEADLAKLERQQGDVQDLAQVEKQMQSFADRVGHGLDRLHNEGRIGVLSMLRVKAEVTKKQVVIRGVVEFPEPASYNYHWTNIGIITWM